MSEARTYPHGVPCWVDSEQPEIDAACHFYGELLGWSFEDATGAGALARYAIASLDGRDVAAIGASGGDPAVAWNTYVAVDDADATAAGSFDPPLFGWVLGDLGFATMIRRPGYGDHLEATVDPDIRTRQADVVAPPGFEDAVAWLAPAAAGEPDHWHVTFAVGDRDESAARAEQLAAAVVSSEDTEWTRTALVRDPQGAEFTLSQFTPPER